MTQVHRPQADEVKAHAAALRALASYLEFVNSIEGIEDEAEYESKLNMYVKGAGSTFLDEIDATGAYNRRIPSHEDPTFYEYATSMAMISIHGMQTIFDPGAVATFMAKLVNLDFCTLLRQEVNKIIEDNDSPPKG